MSAKTQPETICATSQGTRIGAVTQGIHQAVFPPGTSFTAYFVQATREHGTNGGVAEAFKLMFNNGIGIKDARAFRMANVFGSNSPETTATGITSKLTP